MSTPNRIKFKYYDSGWQTITCDINPIEVDFKDDRYITTNSTLDGAPVFMESYFDDRVRTLVWRNLPNKSPYFSMINNLKSLQYIASGVYIQRNDLDVLSNTIWEPIKVLNASFALDRGPASATNALKYSNFTLLYTLRKEE